MSDWIEYALPALVVVTYTAWAAHWLIKRWRA